MHFRETQSDALKHFLDYYGSEGYRFNSYWVRQLRSASSKLRRFEFRIQQARGCADSRRMNLGAPVLIIDDDDAMAESLKGNLEAVGHTAATARNAFHGLKLARQLNP